MERMWDAYIRNSKGWRVDKIARAHPLIYLGSAETVDMFTFNTYGITHVINCAEPEWGSRWFRHEFPERYECMEAEDNETFDITSVYPKFEATMNRFLADPECKGIYVHCQCGINRSAFLLLMYLCIKCKYEVSIAVRNILLQRPCCFRNTVFRKQVLDYIKKLE